MSKRTCSGSEKKGKLHKLFFVGPKPNGIIDKLAERLIELRLVQEVFLEDHNSGYVAKIRFFEDKEPKRPEAYIASNISKDFGIVVKD